MSICLSCLGQKKIQGMGFMGEVDCRTCKGTGVAPVEVKTLEIKPTDSSSNRTVEIKPTDSWSDDALTMKGGGIGKVETFELKVEEEILINAVEPLDSTVPESIAEKFKRKYKKSAK